MARKKKQDQGQGTFSGVVGGKVRTTAVINQLTLAAHKDKISFTGLSLSGEENEAIAHMVKSEADVLMTIALERPDEQFPNIQVRGKLRGFKISKNCDAPDVVNIQFSSEQVQRICNYIRTEEKILLTFVEAEPELEFGDGEEGQPQEEAA